MGRGRIKNDTLLKKTTVKKYVEQARKEVFDEYLPHEKKWWEKTENPSWKKSIERTENVFGKTRAEKTTEEIYNSITATGHYRYSEKLRCEFCDNYFEIDETFLVLNVDCDSYTEDIHIHPHCPEIEKILEAPYQ